MVARQAGLDPDDSMTDFDLLAFLGEDLPGAVERARLERHLARVPLGR
jgi:hypothetical protein